MAYKSDEITTVPHIVTVARGPARERILSLEEAAALFDAIDQDHMFTFNILMFNTVSRPEAILELTRFQIDLDNRLIKLNPEGRRQTKKIRPTVPITDTLLPYLAAGRMATSHLVTWHDKPIKRLSGSWRKLRARAGLSEDVIPYTIRHTMATEMRKRGVPAWDVAGFLGRKLGGYDSTEIYAKYAPDYLSQAAAAIDDYFVELQAITKRQLIIPQPAVRASCVSNGTSGDIAGMAQIVDFPIESMVGERGFEPPTPTSRT